MVCVVFVIVLNLIINGLPSKPRLKGLAMSYGLKVLNLIINGLPSKLYFNSLKGIDTILVF